jgi:hypothetical protein
VSTLFDAGPFAERDDETFLAEMNAVTAHHRAGCTACARIWPANEAKTLAELPYLHVGLFKRLALRTASAGMQHQRTLLSSGTSGSASKIVLDDQSSALQARSSQLIFEAMLGAEATPLIVLDTIAALRSREGVSARIMAAMALKPLAMEMHFVLDGSGHEARVDPGKLRAALESASYVRVYGFTWRLWRAWRTATRNNGLAELLRQRRVDFVHSGGWKKLEAERVDRERFDRELLATAGAGSRVLDFYGLVEQVGVVFPQCEAGFRHVPRWAAVIVRDSLTGASLPTTSGQLQLLNPLALGAPYHSVLTEDVGRLVPGRCPCGRGGQRFLLDGRIARAEVRGCANV